MAEQPTRPAISALAVLSALALAAIGIVPPTQEALAQESQSQAPRLHEDKEPSPATTLIFEAAPGFEATARRLQEGAQADVAAMARRLALEPEGPPIRVILAPEDSPLATNVPPWISGYAYPEVGSLVVLVERVPRYPARSLGDVLRHEIAHVLIGRAAGGAPVPRWLHEGLAMALEGRWGVRDAARFELSRLRLRRVDLQGLDEAFRGDAAATAAAYATAGAFYRDLERRHGSAFAPALLARLAEGRDFDDAFLMLTGRTPQQSLARFSSLEATWVRWVPFLTSPTVLWIAVTLLALWAIKRRRDRDRQMQDRWLAEEVAQAETEVRARERWLEQHRLTGDEDRSRYRRDGDGEWIN